MPAAWKRNRATSSDGLRVGIWMSTEPIALGIKRPRPGQSEGVPPDTPPKTSVCPARSADTLAVADRPAASS